MNTKNPLFVGLVVLVLASFGFYKFLLGPKRDEVSKLDTQITQAQDDLTAAQALLAANTEARKSYQSSYSTVVRLGKAVPGDDDVRSLVVQLDHAAKSTHVDFQGIEVGDATGTIPASTSTAPTGAGAQLPPGATVGPAGFPVMPFSFTFTGDYFRLGEFFQRLNAFVQTGKELTVNGRLLTINGLKLEPDASGFPNIKATVQATSYLVSPLEGETGGATPAGPAGTAATTGAAPADGGSSVTTTTATATGAIR